jgi:hypothetical protein
LAYEQAGSLLADQRSHLEDLLAACPHLATAAERVRQFAGLLTDRRGEDLDAWMADVEADDLPGLHGFVRGLRQDLAAVVAGLTLPTATARSKAPLPRSNSSNDRCMAAPASRSYDNGSCSHRPTATTVSVPEPFVLQSPSPRRERLQAAQAGPGGGHRILPGGLVSGS